MHASFRFVHICLAAFARNIMNFPTVLTLVNNLLRSHLVISKKTVVEFRNGSVVLLYTKTITFR